MANLQVHWCIWLCHNRLSCSLPFRICVQVFGCSAASPSKGRKSIMSLQWMSVHTHTHHWWMLSNKDFLTVGYIDGNRTVGHCTHWCACVLRATSESIVYVLFCVYLTRWHTRMKPGLTWSVILYWFNFPGDMMYMCMYIHVLNWYKCLYLLLLLVCMHKRSFQNLADKITWSGHSRSNWTSFEKEGCA